MTLRHVIIVADSAQMDGGLGKVAVTSAIALAADGLNVTYFCPITGADPGLAAAGVRVVSLDQALPAEDPSALRGMARGIWNRQAAQALRAVCAAHDPADTIVHCHSYSKALSPAIGPVLTGGPLRAVYTMHEYFLACPNGGFFDFPKAEICTRKPLGLSCLTTQCDSRKAVHKAWRVVRQAALHGPGRLPRGLRDVIYISQTQHDVMRPHLPAQARLHHVPNPVDFAHAGKVDAGANDIFLFVGRLEPDKGAVSFAKAARDAGARAVFVGAGREEQAIRTILPNAEITGWVTPDQVSTWLGQARALVFPSLWYECQPLVPMEALHRGVPVIAGGWGAAREVITHNRTGLIYDAPDALAGALAGMTPARAAEMSQVAYDTRDKVGLTAAAHAARLQAVYAKTLQ